MILETERGSTRSHFVENSLWKRQWTRKTDNRIYLLINEQNNICTISQFENVQEKQNCGTKMPSLLTFANVVPAVRNVVMWLYLRDLWKGW